MNTANSYQRSQPESHFEELKNIGLKRYLAIMRFVEDASNKTGFIFID